MSQTLRSVAEPECTRRSLLKMAAAAGGMATIGAPLAGCSKPKTSSKTVKFWDYTTEADRAAEDKWFALFPKAVPRARVQKIFVPSDQMTAKVIGSAASRNGPDAFMESGDLDQLVPAGVVTDLTSYWDRWPDKPKFPAAAVGKRNGKVYSVKAYSNLIGLWYNADILDKVSIAPPTTFDPGLGTKVSAVRQVFGQGWNGVLAGQKTPQRSAQDVVDGLNRLLHP